MSKVENNDILNSIFNSKEQKSSDFKFLTFHTNFAKLYREKSFSSLFEEILDNKNENDFDNNSFIKEFNSFYNDENKINETKLD